MINNSLKANDGGGIRFLFGKDERMGKGRLIAQGFERNPNAVFAGWPYSQLAWLTSSHDGSLRLLSELSTAKVRPASP